MALTVTLRQNSEKWPCLILPNFWKMSKYLSLALDYLSLIFYPPAFSHTVSSLGSLDSLPFWPWCTCSCYLLGSPLTLILMWQNPAVLLESFQMIPLPQKLPTRSCVFFTLIANVFGECVVAFDIPYFVGKCLLTYLASFLHTPWRYGPLQAFSLLPSVPDRAALEVSAEPSSWTQLLP